MAEQSHADWVPDNPDQLGGQFTRLGWLGFWIQLALLAVPIGLLVYILFLSSPHSAQNRGIDLSNYLSYSSLLVMVFTTIWFIQYTRVGKQIADPERRPSWSSVVKTLWIGLWAGCTGIFLSLLILLTAELVVLTFSLWLLYRTIRTR